MPLHFAKESYTLLIPSFSSKGNLLLEDNGKLISDNTELLGLLEEYLYRSYLLSAYDVFYQYIPNDVLTYPLADVIMIDSGGYEISDNFDFCERYKFNYHVNPWNSERMLQVYQKVYDSDIKESSQLIFSSYDMYAPASEQLTHVSTLQKRYPGSMVDFLIKPSTPGKSVIDTFFSIAGAPQVELIGFTEKELGATLREKLLTIIDVKSHCTKINWNPDIHIYGGLEPCVLMLFFLSGANIFDGLSWQKIRFKQFQSTTIHNPSDYDISRSEGENKFWMMIKNLSEMERISLLLDQFVREHNMNDIRSEFRTMLGEEVVFIGHILKHFFGC